MYVYVHTYSYNYTPDSARPRRLLGRGQLVDELAVGLGLLHELLNNSNNTTTIIIQ